MIAERLTRVNDKPRRLLGCSPELTHCKSEFSRAWENFDSLTDGQGQCNSNALFRVRAKLSLMRLKPMNTFNTVGLSFIAALGLLTVAIYLT